MAQTVSIQPDMVFLRHVLASGGGDLKKCYQCAACSVACDLSPETAPFPRKQMAEAQWGLSGKVTADPAIWLCHNCGKCTTLCPRGARPGDVLGAIRREAIRRFTFPRFMGDLVASPKGLPLLFLVPALIFLAIALMPGAAEPAHPFEFANVFPIPVLEPLFFTVSGLALLAFVVSMARFARALGGTGGGIMAGLLPALREIGTHERFTKCDDTTWRFGHLLTFWGFVGLAAVGTVTGIGSMVGLVHTPLPLFGVIKILANVSAAAAAVGLTILLVRRLADPARRRGSAYFDWFFLTTLAGVVLTGILAEVLRLAQTGAMYGVYFVHLVLIFGLLLYAPYSKFAHLAYRTVAVASSIGSNGRT
jgi:quinone-modifying oxidoreductase subunit QmoC